MKVREIAAVLEQMVPLELAQDWDNVGLLVGGANKDVKNVLLTIDVTSAVVAEAEKLKTDLIISYHPVIWDALKTVTPGGPAAVVYRLVRSGIAVYSIHTALDTVAGGVNDGLAEILGIVETEPLGDFVECGGDNYKLVVFVPVASAQKVANAVFAAGAGHIGNYSHCSFRAEGTGTFLPLEGARPAIGSRGRLERVDELRLETIVPAGKLEGVLAAMKKAHPYEEPAFDIFKLHNPQPRQGLGRIGKLPRPTPLQALLERIKKHTGAKAVGIVGRQKRSVKTAAVCAGSCGKLIERVIAAGAELYVTGELKHHHALAAREADLTCICLAHTVSERFMLKKLAVQLKKRLDSVTIRLSSKDTEPFTWKSI